MYVYFNRELFGGQLRPVILNFSRAAGALGFFAAGRWGHARATTHEISLNPSHLATRSARSVASTLAHEMVHCWQQEHGKPGKRGYHNKQWAAKMDEIGLVPSSTGKPDGARTGFGMSHYVADSGAFARAFDRMPRSCLLPWSSSDGAPRDSRAKIKYTCPTCGANAWGKPDLHLVCGDHAERMTERAEGRR